MDLSRLNKEQIDAVNTVDGPVLIIAGAGTGKTTVLTNRLANLIEKGVDPKRILLLTFTNKAANEMTQRAQLLLDERCGSVNGTTYHSFCAELLRRHAPKVGFNSDFTICDSSDASEIVNLVKEKKGYTKELGLPSGRDLIAMFSYIINKEKTLLYTLENRYPNFVDLEEEIAAIKEEYILYKYKNNIFDYDDLLTQTINLFENYPEICESISNYYQYIMVDEYQDSNLLQMKLIQLLRQFENKNICVVGDPEQCLLPDTKINTKMGIKEIKNLDLDDEVLVYAGNDNVIYSKIENITKKEVDEDIYEIITKSGKSIKGTKNHIIFANDNIIKKVKINKNSIYLNYQLLEDNKNGLLIINTYNDVNALLVKKYSENNKLYGDNDKLIDLIDLMINQNPSVNFIVSKSVRINNKYFSYTKLSDVKKGSLVATYDNGKIVIDEVLEIKVSSYNGFVYDINILQYRNYMANNILVHNCIYGFRGSLHENILNFPDQFPGCKIIKLNTNYRSNQEILDLSNQITKDTEERFRNVLTGTHDCGYKPKLINVTGQNDEARFVINKINQYRRDGVSLNDMAVLIRGSQDSNMLESQIMEQMGRNVIPYQKFGGIKFFERDFVKNIFAFIKISINYKDEISWFRILKLYPGIGSINAKKIAEGILKNGIKELNDAKYEKKKFAEFLVEIHEYIETVSKMEFPDQMEYLVNEYYYKVEKRAIEGMKTSASTIKSRIRDLDKEIEQAQVLITLSENYKTASKFINDLLLEVPQDISIDEKLTISTIHSVKGLEFKVVFVLDCVEGKFPWVKEPRAVTEDAIAEVEAELEEEKRVFYVAITRAKDDLYLMYPQFNIFTRQETELTRFLAKDEIYKTYCDITRY